MHSCIEQIQSQLHSRQFKATAFTLCVVLWHQLHLFVLPTMKGLHTNTHSERGGENTMHHRLHTNLFRDTRFCPVRRPSAFSEMLLSSTAVQTGAGRAAHAANGISRFINTFINPAVSLLSLSLCLKGCLFLCVSTFRCLIHVSVYFTEAFLTASTRREYWRAFCAGVF